MEEVGYIIFGVVIGLIIQYFIMAEKLEHQHTEHNSAQLKKDIFDRLTKLKKDIEETV